MCERWGAPVPARRLVAWSSLRRAGTGAPNPAKTPHDTFVASGHGGKRTCWIIPSLDLIVCWNDSAISDHDDSPENPATKSNQAARLMREAVEKP